MVRWRERVWTASDIAIVDWLDMCVGTVGRVVVKSFLVEDLEGVGERVGE